jgi:hypothetical protein
VRPRKYHQKGECHQEAFGCQNPEIDVHFVPFYLPWKARHLFRVRIYTPVVIK